VALIQQAFALNPCLSPSPSIRPLPRSPQKLRQKATTTCRQHHTPLSYGNLSGALTRRDCRHAVLPALCASCHTLQCSGLGVTRLKVHLAHTQEHLHTKGVSNQPTWHTMPQARCCMHAQDVHQHMACRAQTTRSMTPTTPVTCNRRDIWKPTASLQH
jgi:hypothetical protein